MPIVSRITIFPVKSFDGRSCQSVAVTPCGALRHDRQFALADSAGRFINAKRTPLIHQICFLVDPERREFQVGKRDGSCQLSGRLDGDGRLLSDWLSDFLSLDVSILENDETGFPDDLDSPGPTVVSVSSLRTVAGWFPGLTTDDIRHRFRANIEFDGVEAFWEDRLLSDDNRPRSFRIGAVDFLGINPCQRCVVPTRDPMTGDVVPGQFAQQFQKQREMTLPAWSPRERFNHFYRLTTNTRRSSSEIGEIHIGDIVELSTAGRTW